MPHTIEQYLTIRANNLCAIAPDGQRVAYLGNVTGQPQVWLVPAESGWPRQVSFTDDAVRGVSWSPDGEGLVFLQDHHGDERTQLYRVRADGTDLEALTADPAAIHTSPRWSPDGGRLAYAANARDARYFDVWRVDLATRERTCLLETEGNWYPMRWSPDGRAMLLVRENGSLDSDLFRFDLATRDVRLLTPHEGAAVYSSFWFETGGGSLLGLSDQGGERMVLVRLPLDGGPPEVLREDDWDLEGLVLADDGVTSAFTVNAGGVSELWVGPVGDWHQVEGLPRAVIGQLSFDRAGRRLAFDLNGPCHPPDVWLYDRADRRAWPVTRADTAGIPRSALRPAQLTEFRTFDQRMIPAWVQSPDGPAPTGGWPAVMVIHGGPESQTRAQFAPISQYLVERGYLVAAPNVRGSTGYGRAYHQLDNKHLRPDAVRDAARLAEHLPSLGANPARLACFGGSYGGFMVLALVTEYPELFAAGVDLFGVANFETFFERTGPYRRQHRASEYGDPDTERELLRSISPIHKVERIRCPMFIAQGATDPRVPRHESDQIVAALRERGVPVEYLVFPDEGHGMVKLANKIACYGAIAAFLDRHLQAG